MTGLDTQCRVEPLITLTETHEIALWADRGARGAQTLFYKKNKIFIRRTTRVKNKDGENTVYSDRLKRRRVVCRKRDTRPPNESVDKVRAEEKVIQSNSNK